MNRCFAILALFLAIPARAQLFTPEGEKDFDQALVSLYNLDYAESRERSHHLIELEPENPFSYLAESGMIWWQSSNEYGLFKDTPTLQNMFESDIETSLKTGEALLDSAEKAGDKKAQATGHFIVGMALGTRGEWKLIQHHFLSAYFDGKHANKHLKHCLDIDPKFYDAYIGLGLYDYMTGHLPGVLKLSTLFFIHGNVKRGLERMQLAYEHARYTPSYAAQYLATIYIVDQHDDAKALPIIRYLRSHFPKSSYFQMIEIGALARLKDPSSLSKAKTLVAETQNDPSFLGRKQLTLWCGLWGEECLNPHGVKAAQEWFSDAISKEGNAKPSFWLDLMHFYRGVTADLSNQRESAVKDYQFVLADRSKSGAVRELAQHCMDYPCNKEEVVRQLKSMSLETVGAPKYIAPPPPKKDPSSEM